jgi:ketosteroid isomerase-like protein
MLPHAKMQQAVDAYIRAYNNRDVDGMLEHLHPEITFRNVSKGEVILETEGVDEFRQAAEQAREVFSSRLMSPVGYHFDEQVTSLLVDFSGVLAVDLPDGPAAGETLKLRGESIFTFEDGSIIDIEDRSLEAPVEG